MVNLILIREAERDIERAKESSLARLLEIYVAFNARAMCELHAYSGLRARDLVVAVIDRSRNVFNICDS